MAWSRSRARADVPMVGDCQGGMFGFFFAATLPQNYVPRS